VTAGTGEEPLLEDYRALNDPARRRELERHGGFFVVEGELALRALVASSHRIRSVLVAERRAEAVRSLVADRAPVIVRPAADLRAIAGFAFHRGVLAAAERPAPLPVDDVVGPAATLVAVTEGVNDHENLGALFRNAAAFGVDAVVLDPTTADPLYRRSVRVSLGQVLRVPWARTAAWPEALADLGHQGFELLALTPARDAESIDAVAANLAARAARRPDDARVAVIVGAEGPGLSATALATADRRVRIPIAADVDSLNVATAAAIAFHRLTTVTP
jgi:tRNA G18 (ribose-2'-O)-methylase SpoU